jgi:hypothetical protein
MSASRVAAWIIGAAVCGAWLASAAGVTRQARTLRTAPPAAEVVQLDALATDVQAQAGRLRERLANAPAPRLAERNPFRFSARPERRPAGAAADLPLPPAPLPVPEIREPVLELVGVAESKLVGVAESKKEEEVVRTAMITGGFGELMMVTAGQRILGRYDVVAVSDDAVDLKNLETGAIRRLILR